MWSSAVGASARTSAAPWTARTNVSSWRRKCSGSYARMRSASPSRRRRSSAPTPRERASTSSSVAEALEVARHLSAEDVVRPLPALEDDRVPPQPRQHREVLDRAVPAQYLDATPDRARRCRGGGELVRVDEDAVVATSSASAESTSRVTSSEEARAASASARITARLSRTSGNSTIGLAERHALSREGRRLEIRAAHHRRRADGVQPARGVEDDAGRDLEAILERADRIRDSAVEDDLAGGERTRAELVLELADREAVRPARRPCAARGSSRCRASLPARPPAAR